jgi:hypothetical protein
VQPATREIARFTGRILRDAIRDQIPPGGSNNQWDGYAATGRLQSYVVASEPTKTPTGWRVTVYVPRYNLKYWKVHEEGMIIHPKGRWLVFPKPPEGARYTHIPGRKAFLFQDKSTGRMMIATEYVKIRPKRYFAKGVQAGIPIVRAALPKEISVQFHGYGVTT